jgi:hypothetical protein
MLRRGARQSPGAKLYPSSRDLSIRSTVHRTGKIRPVDKSLWLLVQVTIEGRHTYTSIADLARLAPGGKRYAGDICREHGISEATYDIRKKKYAGLGLDELCCANSSGRILNSRLSYFRGRITFL